MTTPKPTLGKKSSVRPERRFLDFNLRTERAEEDNAPTVIHGNGSVFNSLSVDLGGFREMIHPGAFRDVLGDDAFCLFNHDPSKVLGRTASGTLKITETSEGLAYECELPDNVDGRNLAVSMSRGDITQSSFAFTLDYRAEGTDYDFEETDDGWVCNIYRIDRLYDVSPVTYPAYRDASSGVRQLRSMFDAAVERKRTEDATEPPGGPDETAQAEIAARNQSINGVRARTIDLYREPQFHEQTI